MIQKTSTHRIDWSFDAYGEGPFMVFLHGWGVNRRIWKQQMKFFADRYSVMSIDLPGHGDSSWEKISLGEMAQDLRTMLRDQGVKDAVFVSSSLGGLFALKLYEVDTSLMKRMVFVGSMPKFARSEGYPFGLDVQAIRKLDTQIHSAYPSIVNVFFRSLFTKEERSSRRYRWMQRFRKEDTIAMQPALSEYLNILEQEDLREVIKSIKDLPIQFINGAEDTICSQEAIAYVKTLCPDARYDFFAQCGHFPFLSKPHEFNVVLEEFLQTN